MYETTYHRPATIDDAVALFGKGTDAKYLAGGQTLLPVMKQRLAAPGDVIDLARIPALVGISVTADAVTIKAATTHYDVATSTEAGRAIAALAHLAGMIGDPAVRYRGTIGGSIANNDPAADFPAALLALGATVKTNKRTIAADDFFTGLYSTCLEPGELILAFEVPTPLQAAYQKLFSPASGFAMVGVYVARFADGVRVAVTGATACVFRWTEAEQALSARFDVAALAGLALDTARYEPSTDLHASADYRAAACPVMLRQAVELAVGRGAAPRHG